MSAPTPADQAAAAVIVADWTAGSQQTKDLREAIAAALAKERAPLVKLLERVRQLAPSAVKAAEADQ